MKKLFLILSFLLLVSCSKPHTIGDVKKYIREELDIRSFSIVEEEIEVVNPDSYTDKWWTVETDVYGFDEPLIFHVIDYHSYGLFGVTNRLTDDLRGVIKDRIIEEFDYSGNLIFEKDDNYINYGTDVVYPVDSRSDFKDSLKDIEQLQNHMRKYKKMDDFNMVIEYVSAIDEYPCMKDEDFSLFSFRYNTPINELEQQLSKIDKRTYDCGNEYEYLSKCLKYGLWDRVVEFSEEEIKQLISVNEDLTEVRDMHENIIRNNIVYHDVRNISYGNLYHLLGDKSLGTWNDYSFTDNEGVLHHFTYDDENIIVSVEDASRYLGFEVDDGVEIKWLVIPDTYFEYFDIDKNEFVDKYLKEYEGYYRDYEVKDDGFYLYAKPYQLNKTIKDNDNRIDDIRMKLMDNYKICYLSINNMSKVYHGIYFTFDSDDELRQEDYPLVHEAIELVTLNQILSARDNNKEFDFILEVRFKSGDKTVRQTEYVLPDEVLSYEMFKK